MAIGLSQLIATAQSSSDQEALPLPCANSGAPRSRRTWPGRCMRILFAAARRRGPFMRAAPPGSRAGRRRFRRRFQLAKTALSRSSADLAFRSRSLLSLDPAFYCYCCPRCGARAFPRPSRPRRRAPGPALAGGLPRAGCPLAACAPPSEVEPAAVGEGCPHAGLVGICYAGNCEV